MSSPQPSEPSYHIFHLSGSSVVEPQSAAVAHKPTEDVAIGVQAALEDNQPEGDITAPTFSFPIVADLTAPPPSMVHVQCDMPGGIASQVIFEGLGGAFDNEGKGCRTYRACEPCRVRKIKCNGIVSGCKTCVKRGEECIWSQEVLDAARREIDPFTRVVFDNTCNQEPVEAAMHFLTQCFTPPSTDESSSPGDSSSSALSVPSSEATTPAPASPEGNNNDLREPSVILPKGIEAIVSTVDQFPPGAMPPPPIFSSPVKAGPRERSVSAAARKARRKVSGNPLASTKDRAPSLRTSSSMPHIPGSNHLPFVNQPFPHSQARTHPLPPPTLVPVRGRPKKSNGLLQEPDFIIHLPPLPTDFARHYNIPEAQVAACLANPHAKRPGPFLAHSTQRYKMPPLPVDPTLFTLAFTPPTPVNRFTEFPQSFSAPELANVAPADVNDVDWSQFINFHEPFQLLS